MTWTSVIGYISRPVLDAGPGRKRLPVLCAVSSGTTQRCEFFRREVTLLTTLSPCQSECLRLFLDGMSGAAYFHQVAGGSARTLCRHP